MPGDTKIEWTRGDDGAPGKSWNPVTGCTKVSPGCDHCYAEAFAERFRGVPGHPYEQGFDLKLWPERLEIPLRWTRPRRIFVNSMSDLWHAKVPEDFIERVFAAMAATRRHTYMILTKRPRRMEAMLRSESFVEAVQVKTKQIHLPGMMPGHEHPTWPGWPLPNVWLGTSVENQEAAFRIDYLARTPAAVRFLSCEPLLGPLELEEKFWPDDRLCPSGCGCRFPWDPDATECACDGPCCMADNWPGRPAVDWVIAGGESGPGARPMHPDWPRDLRDQCRASGIPFFFKQWGEWAPVVAEGQVRSEGAAPARFGAVYDWSLHAWDIFERGVRHGDVFRVGKHHAGRMLDGHTWDEFPEVITA